MLKHILLYYEVHYEPWGGGGRRGQMGSYKDSSRYTFARQRPIRSMVMVNIYVQHLYRELNYTYTGYGKCMGRGGEGHRGTKNEI